MRAACAAAFFCAIASASHAQPAKTIRIVVPYAPGGAVDAVTRPVSQKMAESLKQTIIIDNKPGASSNIGMQAVAQAAPDGTTLLTASNTLTSNKALFHNLPFDIEKGFAPVGAIGYAPLVIVLPAESPFKTLPDLLAAARATPGKLSYASAGNGSSGHLACELLKMDSQVDVQHIPYKGGAPAITDLIGGRIDFMCINPVEVIVHIRSGRLRAVAVMDKKASPLLPNVPSTAQLQLPNSAASVWWGLVAPRGISKENTGSLNAALKRALADPALVKSMADMGATVTPGTPEEFGEFVKQETVKWSRVIETAKIRAD
jgi:tripartite-type tricarboxylate transporter receptor subunit TctC